MVWAMLCHSGKANENASNAFWLCIGVHFCMLCTKTSVAIFLCSFASDSYFVENHKKLTHKRDQQRKKPKRSKIKYKTLLGVSINGLLLCLSLQFLVVPKSILNMTRNINIQLGMKSVRLWFFHSSSLVGISDWIHGWK